MNVLSIQSAVTFGHVGNSAATFALQRLGHDCWPVATVQLAHHPAHGAWRGRVTPAGELSSTVEALAARGVGVATGIFLLLVGKSPAQKSTARVTPIIGARYLGLVGLLLWFTLLAPSDHGLKVMVLTFGMSVFYLRDMLQIVQGIPRQEYDHARTLGEIGRAHV